MQGEIFLPSFFVICDYLYNFAITKTNLKYTTIMKKSILFLGALFAFVLCVFDVYASSTLPDVDLTIDIKPKQPVDPTVRPFSIIDRDIEATYSAGVLTIESNIDAGVAEIIVTNVYTGEQWYDSINGYGSVSLFIYDTPGDYEIIVINDKCTYRGMFVL